MRIATSLSITVVLKVLAVDKKKTEKKICFQYHSDPFRPEVLGKGVDSKMGWCWQSVWERSFFWRTVWNLARLIEQHSVGHQVQEQDYVSGHRVVPITLTTDTKENWGCPRNYEFLVMVISDERHI